MRARSGIGLMVTLLCWQLTASAVQAQPAPTNGTYPDAPQPAFDAQAYRESRKLERQRERAAANANRPPYYYRRRGLGFAAIGVGAGVSVAGFSLVLIQLLNVVGPHNESHERLSRHDRRVIGATLGTGLPVLAVGIWAVRSAVVEARNARWSVAPYVHVRADAQLGLVAKVRL